MLHLQVKKIHSQEAHEEEVTDHKVEILLVHILYGFLVTLGLFGNNFIFVILHNVGSCLRICILYLGVIAYERKKWYFIICTPR